MPLLPAKEAKTLSFLTYSLLVIYLSQKEMLPFKIILYLVGLLAFAIAVYGFLMKEGANHFPLIPCKERCVPRGSFICLRDFGYWVGFVLSLLLMLLLFKIAKVGIPPGKNLYLIIGIMCALTTVIHGTLKRFGKFSDENSFINRILTFIIGIINGLGILFVFLYFLPV